MTVWQRAFDMVLAVYKLTNSYPSDEKYNLISDMRRAANSVSNNIAEGFGRYERLDKTRFYKISRGSCYELINQILISEALKYVEKNEVEIVISNYKTVIEELDMMIKTIENRKK